MTNAIEKRIDSDGDLKADSDAKADSDINVDSDHNRLESQNNGSTDSVDNGVTQTTVNQQSDDLEEKLETLKDQKDDYRLTENETSEFEIHQPSESPTTNALQDEQAEQDGEQAEQDAQTEKDVESEQNGQESIKNVHDAENSSSESVYEEAELEYQDKAVESELKGESDSTENKGGNEEIVSTEKSLDVSTKTILLDLEPSTLEDTKSVGHSPDSSGPIVTSNIGFTTSSLPSRAPILLAVKSELTGLPPLPLSTGSLLLAKRADISSRFGSKDRAQQEAIASGIRSIKNTFKEIRATIDHLPEELVGGHIDWDFWARVVENYDSVVENEQPELLEAVSKGIPKEFRGIVWQSVARSKSVVMEELYMHLKTEPSIHEKAIKRDLTRTSFFTNVEAVNKAGELFNVIKAYSNFDPDVGYTQGMVFIAIPLIMNMTESECFCLLVTLMKEYELRELYCPEMKGLHLLLHQFDRLLEQKLPLLFNHVMRQGVRSLMYASQWFLTFFSYKFPLDVVLRIFDVIITQGMEALIKLAVNLMLRNETSLLRLNFDALVDFLKLNLFNVYVSDEYIQVEAQESKRFPILSRKPSSKNSSYYKLDQFMHDSMLVEISPVDLTRFKAEFEHMCNKDEERATEIVQLKKLSGQLRHEIKGYETELYTLNHTHIDMVQELVDKKVVLPEVLGDIEELNHAIAKLQHDTLELESKLNSDKDNIPQNIESEIQQLLDQNAAETERFANLDEQYNKLIEENEQLEAEIKKMPKSWFWNK